ncbi:hypothetical protein [Dyadobacter frigoris]|uniref:Uncharacterized protein n=1 Tax=Dyadobacter frigoris TaxID=2576211 RepID=A0A4U6D5S7_9BACT|nr:hypothetical protein [Dyadobacter frigoris]TKT91785.1 hypothetical protein FDK13_11535 [Dyadobacter frigoris]GLU55567.1 hypothetical protein Dfri01_50280 [Dyadobacter frigoris]
MFDKLFYVILSYYSRNTEHKIDTPGITVFFIFSMLFFCLAYLLILISIDIINYPVYPLLKLSKITVLGIGAASSLAVYLLFILNKRYLKIYSKYRSDSFLNSKTGRWIYWGIYILLLLSPIIFIKIEGSFIYDVVK